MRFVTPTFFLLAGVWVFWSNGEHPDRVLVLPFMDALTPDVKEQGRITSVVCWSIAVVLYAADLIAVFRKPPKSDA